MTSLEDPLNELGGASTINHPHSPIKSELLDQRTDISDTSRLPTNEDNEGKFTSDLSQLLTKVNKTCEKITKLKKSKSRK